MLWRLLVWCGKGIIPNILLSQGTRDGLDIEGRETCSPESVWILDHSRQGRHSSDPAATIKKCWLGRLHLSQQVTICNVWLNPRTRKAGYQTEIVSLLLNRLASCTAMHQLSAKNDALSNMFKSCKHKLQTLAIKTSTVVYLNIMSEQKSMRCWPTLSRGKIRAHPRVYVKNDFKTGLHMCSFFPPRKNSHA